MPHHSARAFRWSALAERGHRVDVVAVPNLLDAGDSAFDGQLEELRDWLANLPGSVDPAVLEDFLVGRACDDLIML